MGGFRLVIRMDTADFIRLARSTGIKRSSDLVLCMAEFLRCGASHGAILGIVEGMILYR